MITFLLDHQALYALLLIAWIVGGMVSAGAFLAGRDVHIAVFVPSLVVAIALIGGVPAWSGLAVHNAQVNAVEHRYGVHIDGHMRTELRLIKVDGVRRQCQLVHPGSHARLFCTGGPVREYHR